jgi:hypothetical protein
MPELAREVSESEWAEALVSCEGYIVSYAAGHAHSFYVDRDDLKRRGRWPSSERCTPTTPPAG